MQEEIFLLKDTAKEIAMLRRENQLQAARLTMFDDMMALFKAVPQSTGFTTSRDVLYMIEKHIEFLEQSQNYKP